MTDETPLPATGRRAFLGAALAASALPHLAAADEREWSGRTPTRYPTSKGVNVGIPVEGQFQVWLAPRHLPARGAPGVDFGPLVPDLD